MRIVIKIFIAICAIIFHVESVMFHLTPNSQRCLREDVEANKMVMGTYEVTDARGQVVDYIIRNYDGHILSQKEHITKGNFSVIMKLHDTYEICFISKAPPRRRGIVQTVSLVTKKQNKANNNETISFEGEIGK